MLAPAEELHFKIVLSGTYWNNKPPEFDILFNNEVVLSDAITKPSGYKGVLAPEDPLVLSEQFLESTKQTVEFKRTVAPGNYYLGIRLKNKAPGDTRGFIGDRFIRDLQLHIENISINDVDLHNLIHSESEYIFDTEQMLNGAPVTRLTNCTSLGFNGVYQLEISSPFYIWLLERL
jgi:hypothetical protein